MTKSRFRTSTSSELDVDDAPDLVVIQVYITSAYRAYRLADHYRRRGAHVALGGLHVTSLPDEAARHADTIFLGPGEDTWPRIPRRFQARMPAAGLSVAGAHAGRRAADPPRSDQAASVPGSQLDRRVARMSARLRFLLQGGVFRRRALVLHANRRRRACRDRPPARSSSLFSRRPSVRGSPIRRVALRRHARHGTTVAGGRHHQRRARAPASRAGRGHRDYGVSSSASKRSIPTT